MGFFATQSGRGVLATAIMLACGAPGAAAAQDDATPPPQGSLGTFSLPPSPVQRPPRPERAGPEIDSRLPAQTPDSAAAPPATNSATPVVVPPRIQPTVAPSPAARPVPQARTAATPQRARPAVPDSLEGGGSIGNAPAPAASAPVVTTTPQAQPAATPSPTPSAGDDRANESGARSPWWPLWLAAGLLGLGLASWLMLRRRRSVPEAEAEWPEAEAETVPVAAPPSAPAKAAPERMAPAQRPSPAPSPRPTPPAPATPIRAGRIEIALTPTSVRATLIGWTVGYRLILRNPGGAAIYDVRIAMMMANADHEQPARLAAFRAAPVTDPAHRLPHLAAGETAELGGEVRIDHQALKPLDVAGRAVLIPLVAILVEHPAGQDMAAFVIGQEHATPGTRMAPFWLDQGLRQYRAVGSRPVVLPEPAHA
ncbi:hypothetical protein [Sphingobium aquiterrae]|uniref:hypothetical protein n=1 Tax=Sphingobium aquiterrae TaxID=2038656 RepID=UPI00301AF455